MSSQVSNSDQLRKPEQIRAVAVAAAVGEQV